MHTVADPPEDSVQNACCEPKSQSCRLTAMVHFEPLDTLMKFPLSVCSKI